MNFSQWLKLTMKKKSLRQVDLADASSVPQSHISDLINERKTPTFETCKKLAEAMDTPAIDLLKYAGLLDISENNTLEGVGLEAGKIVQDLSPHMQEMAITYLHFLEGQDTANKVELNLQSRTPNKILKAA